MSESNRLDLIQRIEAKRKSRVVAYITSDREGMWESGGIFFEDVRVIERHLRMLQAEGATKLDLFIYTPGGIAVVPWNLVSLIREYLGRQGTFNVLVPSYAMSAGTKISLGADEIVMGPGGALGPIDVQYGGLFSVEDVRAYLEFTKESGLASRKYLVKAFSLLSEKISPLRVARSYRLLRESRRLATRLLQSRRRPLSKTDNEKIAQNLLQEIGNHAQTVRRHEARELGLKFVHDAEDFGIADHMAQLFDAYEELMHLDHPFARTTRTPDEEDDDPIYEGDQKDLNVTGEYAMVQPIAIVESRDRLDVAKAAYGYRFWRDAPPLPGETESVEREGAKLSSTKAVLTHTERQDLPRMQVVWSNERR